MVLKYCDEQKLKNLFYLDRYTSCNIKRNFEIEKEVRKLDLYFFVSTVYILDYKILFLLLEI